MPRKNWELVLNNLEKEILTNAKKPPDPQWKDQDEQFFMQAVADFRAIKGAWRNHAVHGRDIYTEERAEEIYRSVRSFMRHLSGRLSEVEQSS